MAAEALKASVWGKEGATRWVHLVASVLGPCVLSSPPFPLAVSEGLLSSGVPCVWGLSSLGGAWACPACCGVHRDGTLAPAPPTRTVGAVLLQAGFGGRWVQGGWPVFWEPQGGVKLGQVMLVAQQEEEGQFVL